ncbi:MAG: S41 family peptidase [Sphingomonas sp.]|nr:S41 family peptidase [Sphingomonas sp.]
MKVMTALASAAALAMIPATSGALAQEAATAAPAKVDARAVVADVRRILNENYVLPELRPKLDAALAKGLADGHYDGLGPDALAEKINADLEAVAHDHHLGMHRDPKQAAELAARPQGAGDDDAPPSPEEIRFADRLNHGILQLKVLPGNIRYMETIGFFWGGQKTAEVYDNAMRFLKGGDAIIIDMRQNGGGSPDAVRYMISHFLEPNRPIVTFYMRGQEGDTWKSLDKLPAGRLTGKPLYVLLGGRSASAAEEFIGHVGGFKVGELVGETTAGAGYRNSFFPVSGGYVISVSVGRAILASTGKDWEKVGIAPTIKADQGKALEVAQMHALRKLALTATGRDKEVLEGSAQVLEAQLTPVATALPLPQYVGVYGVRHITSEGGKLSFQREGGPKTELVAVGANEFAFTSDPMQRVKFKVAGNSATELELIRGDGSRAVAARNP